MSYTPDLVHELDILLRFDLANSQHGIKVHKTADAAVIAATQRLHQKGLLSQADLAGYRPVERAPLCAVWLQRRLCGMPPPSSGTLAVAQILTLTQEAAARLGVAVPLDAKGLPTPAFLHVYSDASRLAFSKAIADFGFHI